jgi:hypothetical protein
MVFIYAASLHTALLVGAATRSRLLQRLMTPGFGIVHGAVCIGGAVLAFVLILHSFKNPSLSKRSRILWLPALACGYGLIFYWYNHVRRPTQD